MHLIIIFEIIWNRKIPTVINQVRQLKVQDAWKFICVVYKNFSDQVNNIICYQKYI